MSTKSGRQAHYELYLSYRIRFKTRDSGKDCKEWNNAPGYLIDTCLIAQDNYKARLEYFRIKQ